MLPLSFSGLLLHFTCRWVDIVLSQDLPDTTFGIHVFLAVEVRCLRDCFVLARAISVEEPPFVVVRMKQLVVRKDVTQLGVTTSG